LKNNLKKFLNYVDFYPGIIYNILNLYFKVVKFVNYFVIIVTNSLRRTRKRD